MTIKDSFRVWRDDDERRRKNVVERLYETIWHFSKMRNGSFWKAECAFVYGGLGELDNVEFVCKKSFVNKLREWLDDVVDYMVDYLEVDSDSDDRTVDMTIADDVTECGMHIEVKARVSVDPDYALYILPLKETGTNDNQSKH